MPFLEVLKHFLKRAGCVGKLGLSLRSQKSRVLPNRLSPPNKHVLRGLALGLVFASQIVLIAPASADLSEVSCSRFLGVPYNKPDNSGIMNTNHSHAFQEKLEDGSTVTVLDFSIYKDFSVRFNRAVEGYEDIQQKIYRERLEKFQATLSPDQKKVLSNREEEMKQRSLFVLNSAVPLTTEPPKLLGGARVVFSFNRFQKLPFELDLNINRLNPDVVAAEVGRLTVAEASNPVEENSKTTLGRTVEIIKNALLGISYNSQVQVIYVHTSRVHVRLYKLMGLIPSGVISIDTLNQVMVFTRQQLFEYLKPGALKAVGN